MPEPARPLESFQSYLEMLARTRIHPGLGPHLDASDLVQQTLLEAHRDQEDFRGDTAAEQAAWLRRILTRNLQNAVRDLHAARRDVAKVRSLDGAMDHSSLTLARCLQADEDTPSRAMHRYEEAEALARALAALPEDRRDAVVLRHFHGWSLTQIAELLGRTDSAVAGLLHRGLRDLRGLLEELEP